MKTRNKVLMAALACCAGLSLSANGATLATQQATFATSNFVNSGPATGGSVGRNAPNTATFRAFGLFNVQDLLTTEDITFADLQTLTFTFSFGTDAGTTLATTGTGTYKVGYAGFFQDATFTANDPPTNNFGSAWGTVPYASAADIDTGIADIDAAQTIARPGFSLSALTNDGDLSNDFVVFGISYDENQAAGVFQGITNGSMTLTAIPEPSTALLSCFGLLALLRRRNR